MKCYSLEKEEETLKLFKVELVGKWFTLSEHITYRFQDNGHIIGATFIELDINGKRFVFSGDIGRSDDYLLNNPKTPEWADYLFIESTYGNKLHQEEDVEQILSDLILDNIKSFRNFTNGKKI